MKISFTRLYTPNLLLLYHYGLTVVVGLAKISSPEITPVCDGDQLKLTCNITGSQVEWSVFGIPENETTAVRYGRTLLNDQTETPLELMVNSVLFTFSRISPLNTLPLITRLMTSPASSDINGTVVICQDKITRNSSSTVIVVINERLIPDLLEFTTHVSSEQLYHDDVSITLEWSQDQGHLPYSYQVSVHVVPLPLDIRYSGKIRVQLELSYDVSYNVSVVASLQCDRRNATAFTTLHYASVNCEAPMTQLGDSVMVLAYNDTARESTVNVSCSPGLILTGPNSSTCMGNGEWEPDLGEVQCRVNCGPPSAPSHGHILSYTSTLEGATVTYICWTVYQEANISLCTEINTTAVCNKNENWEPVSQDMCSIFSGSRLIEGLSKEGKIAVASSVTVFTMASVVFFIVGFLCGCCFQNKRKIDAKSVSHEKTQGTPYYDDVILQQREQKLELKENVAYVPIQ